VDKLLENPPKVLGKSLNDLTPLNLDFLVNKGFNFGI
jgi:hypothetical protein